MSMRIVRARLYEAAVPLGEPFIISGGALTVRRSLVVALEDDEGSIGFGEAAPFEAPCYSAETVASARAVLSDWLIPRVLAAPAANAGEVVTLLAEGVVGNEMARAAVETAWWDLRAAREGTTLREAVTRRLAELGVPEPWRRPRASVECGVALGIPPDGDPATLVHWVEEALAAGYRRVKIKIRPGWDVAPARLVLDVVRKPGGAVPVTVDANGAYAAAHADQLEVLDELGLAFIEQPFAAGHLWDLVELSHALSTPICLDESLTSDEVARQVLAMDGPMIWNVKVQRVGGLEPACRIAARAAAAGVEAWVGTMPETGLGAQAGLALAGHEGFAHATDFEPSTRWYAGGSDLVELAMDPDGTMPVPARRLAPDLRRLALLGEWTGAAAATRPRE